MKKPTPAAYYIRPSLRACAARIAYGMRADFQAIKASSNPNRFTLFYPLAKQRELINQRITSLCGWHTFVSPLLPITTLHYCNACGSLHPFNAGTNHTQGKRLVRLCAPCKALEDTLTASPCPLFGA